MRKKVEMLKNHSHMTAKLVDIGFRIVHLLSLKKDLAAGWFFQQIQTAEKGAFSAARWTDNRDFFSGFYFFGNALEHFQFSMVETFSQIADFNHFFSFSFPKRLPRPVKSKQQQDKSAPPQPTEETESRSGF